MMRLARLLQIPPLLVLLVATTAASLAHAQQSSKRTQYACFFDECSMSKAAQGGNSVFEACLKEAFPTPANKLVLPGAPEFAYAKQMVNTRFQQTPAAVVYAHQTADVQAAVKCAYKNNVQVTVAGGRHSYGGWSVVSDFLVVDTSNMTSIKVLGKQGKVMTVNAGPGNTNALLISQLHKLGYSAAGTIVGQCPSVGVSGFMLGGGQGDLSRMFGLACDQVVALEMVTYKGDVVTANSKQNSDLLWASCGGGGALGVVTQWTVKAHDLGNEPMSRIMVNYNAASAIAALLKTQDFIMNDKTDLRFSGGGASPGGFNLYFAGPLDTAMRLLKEGGLLNEWLDKATPSKVTHSRAHLNQGPQVVDPASISDMPAVGVTAFTYANYYETIMEAECTWVAGQGNPYYVAGAAKYGFGPDKSCQDISTLNRFKAMAAERGSPINTGISDIWRIYGLINACRLLPPLNATVWEALLAVHDDPRCATKGSTNPQAFAQQVQDDPDTTFYCFALKNLLARPNWNHLLGGAVAKVPPTATAYPWRKAISPLCVDGGLPDDVLEADRVTLKSSYTLPLAQGAITFSPNGMLNGIKAVQAAYLKALSRSLGEDAARAAYYNYQSSQVQDYEAAYWGPNYARLQQIKSKWDPEGVFSKPFTVQPSKK